jgi:hypothetical protein
MDGDSMPCFRSAALRKIKYHLKDVLLPTTGRETNNAAGTDSPMQMKYDGISRYFALPQSPFRSAR